MSRHPAAWWYALLRLTHVEMAVAVCCDEIAFERVAQMARAQRGHPLAAVERVTTVKWPEVPGEGQRVGAPANTCQLELSGSTSSSPK
jgi:hypothetical protein